MGKRSKAEKADIAAAEAASPLRRNPAIRALGWASEIADQPQLISLCTATFAAGLILRNRRLANTGARMLASELLATGLKDLIKHRVDRTRPRVLANGGSYRRGKGHHRDSDLSSFPSGHMAGAVAVSRAFVRDFPRQTPTAYGCAAAIGAIQVPRSKHYPADVAAGAIVGLAAEAVVRLAERLVARAAADAKASGPNRGGAKRR